MDPTASPVDAPVIEADAEGTGSASSTSGSASSSSPSSRSPAATARLRRSLFHPGRGQALAAVLLFVFGLGCVVQIKANTADDAYANARREDLIQILDGLGAETRRLEREISELERTKTSLETGADSQRVARAETERRLGELSILAGTAPAEGPGIRLSIVDPESKVRSDLLLDAVQEMRDAGAEVIEFNDRIRVVASTWFANDGATLLVDGVPLDRPVTIEVIGDAHSLEEAARFRGGIVSEVTGPRVGGKVQISRLGRIEVDSLHTPQPTQYARPASSPPTPR